MYEGRTVAVVVPAYNEERLIDRVLDTMPAVVDRIIVVGDGMLPMAGGSPLRDPDRRDDTVQVMVGFPAYDPARSNLYARTTEKTLDNAFYYQVPLVRQLGVLRYPSEGAMKMAGR